MGKDRGGSGGLFRSRVAGPVGVVESSLVARREGVFGGLDGWDGMGWGGEILLDWILGGLRWE